MRNINSRPSRLAVTMVLLFPPVLCVNVRGGESYSFEKVAALGDVYPGAPASGGRLDYEFEPYGVNNRGDLVFVTNLCHVDANQECANIGQGVFYRYGEGEREGQMMLLARAGDPAPGGGDFFAGTVGLTSLNDRGEVAIAFSLEGKPYSAGLYLFSAGTGLVRGLVRPGERAPGGGQFAGISAHPTMNTRGEIVFPAQVTGADIDPVNPPGEDGLGVVIFLRSADGEIRRIVGPGDPAPGGGLFDYTINPWINDCGEIAFGAHLTNDPCLGLGDGIVWCAESVYRRKASGETISIAHQGLDDCAGKTCRLAFGPILNNHGEIAFIGDLTPAATDSFGKLLGVFLWSQGKVIPIALPGDEMPGGGKITTCSFFVGGCDLDDRGDVSFNASLDTDSGPAQGLYVWSQGDIHLVARTGTDLPGIGTVTALLPPGLLPDFPAGFPWPWVGTARNELGQIFFTAALEDGSGVLVLATPEAPPAPPEVIPPHLDVHGKTLGEWALQWYEWSLSIPLESHPTTDPDGRFSHIAQAGPVFFLAGTPGGAVERACTVPAGKNVLLPIAGAVASGGSCVEAHEEASRLAGAVIEMGCAVDGKDVPGLRGHREILCCGEICVPGCNGDGGPAGRHGPISIDGYWLMLEPLNPGPHVVQWSAKCALEEPGENLEWNVKYALTVEDVPAAGWFRRGDANDDGKVNLSDAVFVLGYLFLGAEAPSCKDAADTQDDGTVNLTDAVYLLNWLFLGGCPPPAPGAEHCGPDNRTDPPAACGTDDFPDCGYQSC